MRIKNFFSNAFGLIKAMFHTPKIFWNWNTTTLESTTVHAKAVLYPPYSFVKATVDLGTAIGPSSRVSETSIGRFCSIGPNFLCGWGIHPIDGISTSPVFYSTKKQAGFTYSTTDKIEERKKIEIGNDVFIGANVTVLDGVTIGNGAVIGAGAVVSKDIPPYAIAVGCPIQIIRYRFSQNIIERLMKMQWWYKEEQVWKEVEEHFFDMDLFLKKQERKTAAKLKTETLQDA
jgi:virginiamycin A acetyltransferase